MPYTLQLITPPRRKLSSGDLDLDIRAAHVGLAAWSTNADGTKLLSCECASLAELNAEVKRLKSELDAILLAGERYFMKARRSA